MEDASSVPSGSPKHIGGTDSGESNPIRAHLIKLLNWFYPKSKLIGHISSNTSSDFSTELRALRAEFKQHANLVNKHLQNAVTADATMQTMHTEILALRAEVADLKRAAIKRAAEEEPPKKKTCVDVPVVLSASVRGYVSRQNGVPRVNETYAQSRSRMRPNAATRYRSAANPWISDDYVDKPGTDMGSPVMHGKVNVNGVNTEIVGDVNTTHADVDANGDVEENEMGNTENIASTSDAHVQEVSEDESVEYEVARGLDMQTSGDDNEEEVKERALAQVLVQTQPKGRRPHDSNGDPMVWDVKFAVWRSVNNYNETKTPNRSTGISRSKAIKGKPRGRTPFDSHGVPMMWDAELNLWRSANNPSEMKSSTPRAVTHSLCPNTGPASPTANFVLPTSNHF